MRSTGKVFILAAAAFLLFGGCRWERREESVAGRSGPGDAGEAPAPSRTVRERSRIERTGIFPGAAIPGGAPTIFAPRFVSTGLNERDAALAPSGDAFYFSVGSPSSDRFDIVAVRKVNGLWHPPAVVSFSGGGFDLEPFLDGEGKTLYFASCREGGAGGWDIWVVGKEGRSWGEPRPVAGGVNSAGDEFFPCVTANGSLYFTADREDGFGGEDLYVARPDDGRYGPAKNLGAAINGETDEFNAWVDPDERFIVFSSFDRGDGEGGGDLYVSYRGADGNWTEARNLGPAVNSPALDYCPSVSPDAEVFFFTSTRVVGDGGGGPPRSYDRLEEEYFSPGNGLGDIYWMKASFLMEGIE